MIIVNITILFFLTTIILSLLSKNKEGLTCSKKDDQYAKLLIDNNSKQIKTPALSSPPTPHLSPVFES